VPSTPASPVTREFTAFGSKVVETNMPFKGPEDEKDFWEGDQFDGEPKGTAHMGQVHLGLVD
jgi:hypothetical protein